MDVLGVQSSRVMFTARPNGNLGQVYGVNVENELLLSPELRIGATSTVTMVNPGSASGRSIYGYLAGARGSFAPPSGFLYTWYLDPYSTVSIFSTNAPSGSASLAVPNDPALIGGTIYFQGITEEQSYFRNSHLMEAAIQ